MAYPIEFNKEDAQRWLEAIKTQTPLPMPESGGWSINAMTALAGVLHFAAVSRGPLHHPLPREQEDRLPPEHREAREETLYQDLTAAIEFNSLLAMLLENDQFDYRFEPLVQAVVYKDADGQRKVVPRRGFSQ
jgi:hypothetical protein